MEGFKPNQKMKSQLACFREGGYVTKKQLIAFEKKEDREEEKKDIAEDKKIVKKAIGQHESAQHKGSEKTEIKLKAGRRVKKEGGVVNKFKKGGQTKKMAAGGKFFNEEPDDATAAPKKPKTKPRKKPVVKNVYEQAQEAGPMGGMGSVSDAERQQIMDMMQGGPGAGMGQISDYERSLMQTNPMQGMGAVSDYERQQVPQFAEGGAAFGGAFGPRQPETADGMGQATATGGMGNAAAMGAPSDQERNIMRGLAAIGSFCYGGKV